MAVLTPHDGALHPVHWYRMLATAAEAAGARIFERSRVAGPVPAPGEAAVPTDAGSVRAGHVVVAADGALPALVPDYAGRVRARRLHMVATEPVPPVVDRMVYARWGYEYLQQRPDGRILAGGFSDVDGDSSYTDRDDGNPVIWKRVERYLGEELGVSAEVTHRWAGVVGYSNDQLPYVGEVPGRPDTVPSIECLDGNAWQRVATMRVPRHGLAVVAERNRVHFVAGGPQPGAAFSDAHEILEV